MSENLGTLRYILSLSFFSPDDDDAPDGTDQQIDEDQSSQWSEEMLEYIKQNIKLAGRM